MGTFLAWVIGAAVFILTLNIFSGDYELSIPDKPPVTEASASVKEDPLARKYYIIYNENFRGSATVCPTCSNNHEDGVSISLLNDSKNPYRFQSPRLFLWTNDGVEYELEIEGIVIGVEGNATILNPNNRAYVIAKIKEPMDFSNVKGFTLISKGEKKIRFGYKKLSWWDEVRWELAKELKK